MDGRKEKMKFSLILLCTLMIVVPSWCNSRDNETPILPETGESETNPRVDLQGPNNSTRETGGTNPLIPQGADTGGGAQGHQIPPYQNRGEPGTSRQPSGGNPSEHLVEERQEFGPEEPEGHRVPSNNSAPRFLHPGHPGLVLAQQQTANASISPPGSRESTTTRNSFSQLYLSSAERLLPTNPRHASTSTAKPPTEAGGIIVPELRPGITPETSSPSMTIGRSSPDPINQTLVPSTSPSAHSTSNSFDRITTPAPVNSNDSVLMINPTQASIHQISSTSTVENQIAPVDGSLPLDALTSDGDYTSSHVLELESSNIGSIFMTAAVDTYEDSRILSTGTASIVDTLQPTPSSSKPLLTKLLEKNLKTTVIISSLSLDDSLVTSITTPLPPDSGVLTSTEALVRATLPVLTMTQSLLTSREITQAFVRFDSSQSSFTMSTPLQELDRESLVATPLMTWTVATSASPISSTTEDSRSLYTLSRTVNGTLPGTDVNETEAQASTSSNWTVEIEATDISNTSDHFLVNGSDLYRNDTDVTAMPTTKTTLFSHLITSLLPQSSKPTVKTSTTVAANQTKTTQKTLVATTYQGQTGDITITVLHATSPPDLKPPLYIRLGLQMTWSEFCESQHHFLTEVVKIVEVQVGELITMEQIIIFDESTAPCANNPVLSEDIMVRLYLSDRDGNFNATLTEQCGLVLIERGFQSISDSRFKDKVKEVLLVGERPTKPPPNQQTIEPGITIAIAIASVGGLCCVVLILLQVVLLHRRHGRKMRTYIPGLRQYSVRSMDSIALSSVTKARPHSGYFNPGMDTGDKVGRSLPVNFAGLANFSADVEPLYEQFQLLPEYVPSLSDVPKGSEEKNRYANVLPFPETRVYLSTRPEEDSSDYINANYITGYKEDYRAYIATQAPLDCTINDFWKMIWEQQARVIIMLTPLEEHGLSKCAEYWPNTEGVDTMRLYGDYQVELKNEDIKPEYIVSTFILKYMERNLTRELKHFWFTNWPQHSNPDPVTLVKFIKKVRPHFENSSAPVVVHCSPGTGRTGSFIATDICMRMYEATQTVDVLDTVCKMRLERAGMVQTREQYALIYKALNEYAMILNSPPPSKASSIISLQTL